MEYELQVLGTFMQGQGLQYIDVLSADDFILAPETFKAIKDAVNDKRQVNIIEISARSEFGIAELAKIMTDAFPSMVESNINNLKKQSSKRRFERIIKAAAISELDIQESISSTICQLQSIELFKHNMATFVKDAVRSYVEEFLNRRETKLMVGTGIPKLDKLTAGFHSGELTIIGARPGIGKSLFALQIATTLSIKGYRVLFVSLEMSCSQIIERMLVRNGGIDHSILRLGNTNSIDLKEITLAGEKVAQSNFSIDLSIRTISDLRAKIIIDRPDIVLIDYIGLMRDTSEKFKDRYYEISSISRKLKLMTFDFSIPIIALAQLGRTAEAKAPKLSELRDSGSLEQDADQVIFLHRLRTKEATELGYFKSEEIANTVIKSGKFPTNLILEKQRNGPTGVIRMFLDSKTLSFLEMQPS